MTTWDHAASKWKAVYTLSLLLLLVGTAPAHSAAAGDAGGFIADLGSRAIHIINDAGLSAADRQHSFLALMKEDFDLPKIARSVLGRYWQETSDTERQQFTDAFAEYMARIYGARFADYDAQSFRVTAQRAVSDTTTLVSTEINFLATGAPVNVDWSVAKTLDSYKITDIGAGGVSLSRAQREEFSRYYTLQT